MTKEALIEEVQAQGYSVDFTPGEDCLYCQETGNRYLLEHFSIEGSFPFTENGQPKMLHTIQSTEHGLTGYYIQTA